MGIKVSGIDELTFLLRQVGPKAQRGALDAMRDEAQDIVDLAKKYAPIDKGNLEEAIRFEEQGGGRDSAGRFARKEIVIGIDADKPADANKTVGDYAYEMHEHLTPYGEYKLGPRSMQKQAGQSERVGGKFLERAVNKVSKGMIDRIIARVRSQI